MYGTLRRCITLVGVITLTLSGCAIQPVSTDQVTVVERNAVDAFELQGRLSATDSERGASGQVTWSHSPMRDEWTLFSPLGQIIAQMTSTPQGAVLRSADGRTVEAESAEAMLPDLLGVSVPLTGLSYWVQGVVRPRARIMRTDSSGRPERVSDAGWIIDYTEYATDRSDAPVRRMEASRGDARVRLILDQWTPLP